MHQTLCREDLVLVETGPSDSFLELPGNTTLVREA